MRLIVVDLEATCWENQRDYQRMEIIEIGAVVLEGPEGQVLDEFSAFVRPTAEPVLSDFCKRLTTIRQKDVDSAPAFPEVFSRFLEWIGQQPHTWGSWGDYDKTQFRVDAERHAIDLPIEFESHLNLKKAFAKAFSIKPCGMARALSLAGVPLEGTHHRGIDDAKNIAKLTSLIWPSIKDQL